MKRRGQRHQRQHELHCVIDQTGATLTRLPVLTLVESQNDRDSQRDSHSWYRLPHDHPVIPHVLKFIDRAYRYAPSKHQWPSKYNKAEFEHPKPKPGQPRLFDGAIACSFMKENMDHMYSGAQTRVWSYKTNGVRYQCIMMSTPVKGYEQTMLFRNRFGSFFVAPTNYICPSSLFLGTLWDGEMIWNLECKQLEMHFFGNLFTAGVTCAQMDKIARMQCIQNVFEFWDDQNSRSESGNLKDYQMHPKTSAENKQNSNRFDQRWVLFFGAPFAFYVKPWYTLRQAALYKELREKLDYPTDPGNIIDTVEYPEIFGPHNMLFKRKDGVANTIDLFARIVDKIEQEEMVTSNIKPENGQLILGLFTYCLDLKKEVLFTYHACPDAWPYEAETCVVECEFDTKDASWHIKNMRPDKRFPNDKITVLKTMQNIEENISWEDVCTFLALKDRASAWKNEPIFDHQKLAIDTVYDPSCQNKIQYAYDNLSCIRYGFLQSTQSQQKQPMPLVDDPMPIQPLKNSVL